MNEEFSLGAISDVNKGTLDYVYRIWGVKFFLPAVVFLLLGLIAAYFWNFPYGLVIALVWLIGGMASAYGKVKGEFMKQFALANNFKYRGDWAFSDDVSGTLFTYGNNKKISHVVEGIYKDHRLRIFFYSYSTGSGKNKQTYNYSVAEVTFKGQAPDIVLSSRDDWDFGTYTQKKHKKLEIEAPFSESFSVYTVEDLEIETLQIFTRDVMDGILKLGKGFNFEFVGDKLYVFRLGEILKKVDLESFLELLKYLVENVAPKVFNIGKDVMAMKEIQSIHG